jgi:plastocyanin
MMQDDNPTDTTIKTESSHNTVLDQKAKRLKKAWIFIFLLVLVAAAVGTFYYFSNLNTDETSQLTVSNVDITENGFNPAIITITKGSAIEWKNTSQSGRRIAAEPFPTGESFPELDPQETIEPNDSYIVVFDQTGTFNYYDYADPLNIKGTIIVK